MLCPKPSLFRSWQEQNPGSLFPIWFKSQCLSLVFLFATSDPAISAIWCFIKAFPNLLLIIDKKCVPVTNPYGDTSLICPQPSKSKIKTEGKKGMAINFAWSSVLERPKVTKWSYRSFVGPAIFVFVVFNSLTFKYRNFTQKSTFLVSLDNSEDLATFGCCLKCWILEQWTFVTLWPPASASPLPHSGEAPVHKASWEADVFPIIQVLYSRYSLADDPGLANLGMSPRL